MDQKSKKESMGELSIRDGPVPSILDTIGNTPLVKLERMNKKSGVFFYAKLEACNPGGSVKDRPAYYMIKKAEKTGELSQGKIILEPTS
jgi:cysteine synthase B